MSANKELELEQVTDLINKKFVKAEEGNTTTFRDVYAPGALIIRPSGNPLSQKVWEEM